MDPHPSPPVAPLLARLAEEEELIRAAATATAAAVDALRAGKVAAVTAAAPDHEALAARLAAAGEARRAAAEALGAAAGLPPDGLTLAALAARVPGPAAADLLAARRRLAAAAAGLADVQRRYANLASHLRSYFRGVVAGLTAAPPSSRYGPSGVAVGPAGGTTLQTRG